MPQAGLGEVAACGDMRKHEMDHGKKPAQCVERIADPSRAAQRTVVTDTRRPMLRRTN